MTMHSETTPIVDVAEPRATDVSVITSRIKTTAFMTLVTLLAYAAPAAAGTSTTPL